MYIQTTDNKFYRLGPITTHKATTIQLTEINNESIVSPEMTSSILVPDEVITNEIEESIHDWLISEQGPFSNGDLLEDNDYELLIKKLSKLAEVKLLRDEWEIAPVQTPYGIVDADTKSQQKITGAVVMALILGEQFAVKWRMYDNTIVDLIAPQMIEMGMIVGQTVAKYQMVKNYFDSLINQATTVEELNGIDLGQSWMTLELA